MKFTSTNIDRHEWAALGQDRFQREYMLPLRPTVITGGFDHWAARSKWTPDFFSQQHGERTVIVDGQRWRLGDLINEIQSSTPEKPAPYLRNQLLARLSAELLADVMPMPECARPNWLESRAIPSLQPLTFVELYIGGAGAKFPVLHYDNLHTHAFLMQLYGEKEYIALAPDQASFLYPQDAPAANKSGVDDLENPDLKRFPLFDQARAVRFKLSPGETLFVPAGWWHTARILSTSITVSINGANKANWSAFRKDFVDEHKEASRWRARMLQPYLLALGALLSLQDLA